MGRSDIETSFLSENDLNFDAKRLEHNRLMKLLDRLYGVVGWIVVCAPVFFTLWFVVLLIHAAFVNDWKLYEDYGRLFLSIALPYAVGLLTRFGLLKKQE